MKDASAKKVTLNLKFNDFPVHQMGVNLYQIHQFGAQVSAQVTYKLLFLLIFYLRVKD